MSDGSKEQKVKFEVVDSKRIPFGKNNFLEVARKKAVSDSGTTEFISLSRGYTVTDGTDRYKSSISVPDEPDIRRSLAEYIQNI